MSESAEAPGILLSLSSDDDSYTFLGGSRAEVATWEKRWIHNLSESDQFDYRYSEYGNKNLLTHFKSGEKIQSFELDVSWDDELQKNEIYNFINQHLPSLYYELINSLPELNPLSINSNSTIVPENRFSSLEAKIFDLPINTFPSSRQRTRPYVTTTRWVRIIITRYGLISLWHPPNHANWEKENVHWPHTAIPSREKKNLQALETPLSLTVRVENWFLDIIRHEKYFADSWNTEIEFWQSSVYKFLNDDLQVSDVSKLRKDLSLLAQYVSYIRWTQRAFLRKAKETNISEAHPNIKSMLVEAADYLDETVNKYHRLINDSFILLSTVSQQLQEQVSQTSQRNSEKLNQLITIVTAVLIVPSLISGIYGANVKELTDGAKGSLIELSFWITGLIISSFYTIQYFTKKKYLSAFGIAFGILIIFIYEFIKLKLN